MDAEIPVNYVTQLSGHKNLKSLDAYKAASTVYQRKMYNVLRTTATSTRSDETSLAQYQPSTSMSFSSKESATIATRASGLFSGAKIDKFEGCTFNFNFVSSNNESCSSKKRQFVLDSEMHQAFVIYLTTFILAFGLDFFNSLYRF